MDHSSLFRTIGAAAPVSNHGTYLRSGRHLLILLKYEAKPTQEGQTIIAGDFCVQESVGSCGQEAHQPGELVTAHWRMTGLKDWQAKKEYGKAQGFLIALLDAGGTLAQLKAQDARRAEEWLQSEGLKLIQPAQPGRGLMVVAASIGVPVPNKTDPSKPPFVNIGWTVASGMNSPEQVMQRRAAMDQQFGPPMLYGSAAPAPGPSFGHAMQSAPPPSAPPSGYPMAAPGYPPAAPAHGYPSPAPGYPPGYTGPVPGQPQQPTGTAYGQPAPAVYPGMLPPGFK